MLTFILIHRDLMLCSLFMQLILVVFKVLVFRLTMTLILTFFLSCKVVVAQKGKVLNETCFMFINKVCCIECVVFTVTYFFFVKGLFDVHAFKQAKKLFEI